MALIIDEQLILTDLDVKNSKELFQIIGNRLFDKGLVTERFIEEITKREEKYPTGLPTRIPISLCHTDSEHVIKPFLTVATLRNPVPFREMGNSSNVQSVKIAFFLGLIDKKEHINFLGKILRFVRSEDILKKLYESGSPIQIKQILIENLV